MSPEFIHKFKPANNNTDLTLLLLHGTGGDETDLLGVARAIDGNAALLSPRGNVLENGMPRFFRRLAEGVFDEKDLIARTHELADFVAAAAKHYQRDPTKIIAVGFSNGANIAAAMMLLRPEALRAGVLIRAMVPLIPAQQTDLSGKSALILSGTADPIVPRDNAGRLAKLLRDTGADVTHKWIEASHGLTMEDIETARGWIASR
ncbi:MAG: alpha/beta hydrolase [Anaerolineae bacterium]|nr:alpha/beta hydrolase [Phycisphaerae bacterium]